MINTFISILEFILIFGVMIFLHELGHFVTAKIFKIKVEEFGFGYPPKMLKIFTWKGTEFTLNWIPFGGFVRVSGENSLDEPNGFLAANPWKRLVFLGGGSFMNIMIGILLFSLVFVQVGAADTSRVQIVGISPGSPAEAAGILAGDIIYSIDSEPVESMEELSGIVLQNLGNELNLAVYRNKELISIDIIPRIEYPEGEGAMGITMSYPVKAINWFEALPYAVQMTVEQTKQLVLMPAQLIKGQIAPEEARLVGPKGIYDMFSQAKEMDQEIAESSPQDTTNGLNTLYLLAILSVAIGLTNLLPIPALDGGRILFLIPEILFKKRVPPEYENLIHLIGFSAMIILLFYVTFQDIFNPIVLP